MIIKVRNSIRILGFILCLIGYLVNISIFYSGSHLDYSDIFWIIFNSFFFLPLVLASSILGHVPLFISNKIPKPLEKTTLNAEKNFKVFSLESIVGATIFFVIIFLTIYFQ